MNWPDFHLPHVNFDKVPDWVWPLFLCPFTAWFGWACYQRYLKGEALLPRSSQIYYRDKQPGWFWFGTGFSAIYFLLLAFISAMLSHEIIQKRVIGKCQPLNAGTQAYYQTLAKACDASLHSMWASSSTLNILHDNKGFALQRTGADRPAISDFTKAITLNPQDEWAFYSRGLAYKNLGELKKAIADFDAALALRPNDSDVLRSRASLNLNIGEASKAIADLNKVAVKDAWVFKMLSVAHAEKRECDVALQFADKALLKGDKSFWPYQVKGDCLGHLRHVEDALAAYDGAIRQNPKDTRPYIERANLDFRGGKYADAIEDLSRGLRVLPDNPDLLYRRCYFRALSGREAEGALSDCNAAIRSAPNARDILEARVMAIYRAEEYDIAEYECTKLLRQFPDSSTAFYIRGLARRKLGDPLGNADIATAQDKDPSDVSSLITQGFRY